MGNKCHQLTHLSIVLDTLLLTMPTCDLLAIGLASFFVQLTTANNINIIVIIITTVILFFLRKNERIIIMIKLLPLPVKEIRTKLIPIIF